MTKGREKKLRTQIEKYLKEKGLYSPTDDVLIQETIDWIKISDFHKARLADEPDSWAVLTTITTCSKQLQSLYTKLHLTPAERAKFKIETARKDDQKFDVMNFINR